MRNTLYYGDNLTILREHVADETIDLIYLDPPFNSARDYNVLFKQAKLTWDTVRTSTGSRVTIWPVKCCIRRAGLLF